MVTVRINNGYSFVTIARSDIFYHHCFNINDTKAFISIDYLVSVVSWGPNDGKDLSTSLFNTASAALIAPLLRLNGIGDASTTSG